jgi:hypothetical protein
MPALRNAFKYRLADRQSLDTSLFLNLYCPILLDRLSPEDFSVGKLLIFRGSPGSGKSSFLRLFQTESLISLCSRRIRPSDDIVAEGLQELGVLADKQVRYVGLYVQCDSNLRDLANADFGKANLKLLNTLLDVRIVLAYLRGLRQLRDAGLLSLDFSKVIIPSLPPEDSPPPLFSRELSFSDLEAECSGIEAEFATLLNSFPGDPIPARIVPHARVFSFLYLANFISVIPTCPTPVLLLDDLQDLYENQREHLQTELLRRSSIPRWVAVRKYVYELEQLLPLEGTKDGREISEIDLDQGPQGTFRRFLEDVTERRLQLTEVLQQYTTQNFRERLVGPQETVPIARAKKGLEESVTRFQTLGAMGQNARLPDATDLPVARLLDVELQLILAERKAQRDQPYIFEELTPAEPSDTKTEEAARLFMTRRYDLPYYFGFDALASSANRNVEQFLDITGAYIDKMIFRAELGRPPDLTAKEQDDLLKQSANRYYDRIEQGFPRGYSIRQFVDNLGRFFQGVTNRPNAPIAPGVTGFGLTREHLRNALALDGADEGIKVFRETLASAVAGNVLSIKKTKQGQPGAQKIVFYLNRLLCIKFALPLNYGGWQRVPTDTLIKMMRAPVAAEEWGKKWAAQPFESEESE